MSRIRSFATEAHAAIVPFVYRVFRGQRLKRYGLVSLAFAALSVLFGSWLAFGDGELERELRAEFGLEQSVWERAHETYTDLNFQSAEYEWSLAERERILDGDAHYGGPLGSMMEQGKRELEAATFEPAPPQHRDLQQRAAQLLQLHPLQGAEPRYGFEWNDKGSVTRLQSIVDAELVPNVELYTSPLSLRDGIGVIGIVAGGVGLLVLLVGGPLFAGAQIAQEAHENTLQPLLGTRLTPRALVIGLTAGPLAAAGLFAAPQLLVYTIAALTAGNAIAVPGFIAITLAASLLLTMITQLLGYGMGRRWASGLVGTGLSVLLVTSMIAAIGLAANLEDETAGAVAIMPQAGSVHLLVETFVPQARLLPLDALLLDMRMTFAGVAFAVLAAITVLALERRITLRTQPALRRVEAGIAAVTLIVLALSAIPELTPHEVLPAYYLSLGLLLIPFQVLIMGRVPIGDGPAKLRKIPLTRVLADFALWVGIHGGVVFSMMGGDFEFSAGGMFYLLWALGVAALCAVRVAATPLKPLSAVYVCFALFTAVIGYGLSAACFAASRHEDVFLGFFDLSPVLGIVQLVVTVGVPLSLVHALQRNSAGLE